MSYTNGLDKPTDYFNTKLYTGTGANQSITGVGHQPDLVWIKDRTNTNNHVLTDSVRGVEKVLLSNANNLEDTYTDGLTAFNSDGFSLGDDDDGQMNVSGNACVSWNWKKSTTSGFDIVLYTGNASGSARAISHSLGATPGFMLTKNRTGTQVTGTDKWVAFNKSFVAGDYIHLDLTAAKLNSSGYWGGTLPTSSNFYVGGTSANVHNESGIDYVAYLWAEKKGYSKFGSYTGNGSSDGSYIHLGFKPAWVMTRRTDTTENWAIFDNKRDGFNVNNRILLANVTDAENTTATYLDLLSNGFKARATSGALNASGGTYIYMAFAESPFVTSTGIPTTAR